MITLKIVDNYEELSLTTAISILIEVIVNPSCVLGLPTGKTLIGTYEWLRTFAKQNFNFSNAMAFDLNEYLRDESFSHQEYCNFIRKNLFEEINFKKNPFSNGDELTSSIDIDLQLLEIESNLNTLSVPSTALSKIMSVPKIIIIASGESKAHAIDDILQGPISPILQNRNNCTYTDIIADKEAASLLSPETIAKYS